jgi:hypothetical protein
MRRILLLAALAALPCFGARSYITGFEMGSLSEFSFNNAPGISVQSGTVRTGTFALQVSNGLSQVQIKKRAAGGTLASFCRSFRFYFNASVDSATDEIIAECMASGGTVGSGYGVVYKLSVGVRVFALFNASTEVNCTTSGSAIGDGNWHRVEADFGTGATLTIDGVQDAGCSISSATTFTTQTQLCLGACGRPGNSADGGGFNVWFIDDVLVDDTTFTSSGFPGAGQSVLLKPTADPGALGSWTGGGGGTTNLWDAVNNTPPTGALTPTNTTQIKNAVSGTTLDYVATMQTYTAAGVPSGATINAVMPLCNDSEEASTGTKSGNIWSASNPAQSAPGNSFDYGDDTATVMAAFPTGWTTHYGPTTASPSVTLGTAPTVTVRKATATTRVVDVDFLAMYVDYSTVPKRLPLLGVGALEMPKTFQKSQQGGPNRPHGGVDIDLIGMYVDYTPTVLP